VIARLREVYYRWRENREIRRLFKHGVPIPVETDKTEYR
jgi:hypothetical protein